MITREKLIKDNIQHVADESSDGGQVLKSPVHRTTAWSAVSAVGLISLILVSVGGAKLMAQTDSMGQTSPSPATTQQQQDMMPQQNGDFQQLGQPNQNNQQQPWADMCSDNTALACVNNETGKFVTSPKEGPDKQPICPENSTAKCGNYDQNNRQGGQQGNNGGGQGQMNGQPGNFNNQQGQQGNNQNQQQGPSEEQIQKMDQQRLEMMKKNLKQFINEIARVKVQIKSLNKKGVPTPTELAEAIAQMDSIAEKVKNATSADDIDTDMNDFQDSSNTVREWMGKLGRLAQWPQMVKKADAEIKRVEKAYTNDAKKVKSSKLDISDTLAEFRTAIDEQKAVLAQAKTLLSTDPETAMDNIQDDFFSNMDNMWEKDRTIQMALNIKQGITQMARDLKDADKQVASLKKKKVDTTELVPLLNQAKEEFAQVKTLAAVKPMDTDEVMNKIEDMMSARQEFADKIQELTGDTGYIMPAQPQGKNQQFNMPSGFTIPEQQPPVQTQPRG